MTRRGRNYWTLGLLAFWLTLFVGAIIWAMSAGCYKPTVTIELFPKHYHGETPPTSQPVSLFDLLEFPE